MARNKWPDKISGRHLAGRLGDVAAMHDQAHAAAASAVLGAAEARLTESQRKGRSPVGHDTQNQPPETAE